MMWQRIPDDFRWPAAVMALGLLLTLAAWVVPAVGEVVPPPGFLIAGFLLAVFLWTNRMHKEQPNAQKALRRSCCLPQVDEDEAVKRCSTSGAPLPGIWWSTLVLHRAPSRRD